MLEKLRNLNIEKIDLDEAVALAAFGNSFAAAYKEYTLETPAWVVDNLAVLQREIKDRRRDNLSAALKEAEARLASLKTAEEKRTDLASEIARLKAALG